ncbi:hypothetical protein O0235_03050 [Tepidiforma flava]|uniref:Flagellin n=1 Tax=Tepidiforma flava TaxID=3004094 RepID=A0ABY7M8X5_9CHLR|nr:hypothetical protein [Tepidiforma flava]WBL36550.1 hypothetical protein O0235_03050 [Tepidiforma flava]
MSSIVTNIAALNGNRNLSITNAKMGKVLEKLSSGYRINRAADDAAGLGISEKMRAQIRGNSQAIRNAKDGISMIQTAEGAMDEIHSILQRMRELGVQAANDTYDTAARTSIGTELIQLRQEIDRIANATNFNGQNLLTGALTGTLGGATGTDLVVNDAVGAAIATEINVAGAKPGTYTFSYNSSTDELTLTGPSGQAQSSPSPLSPPTAPRPSTSTSSASPSSSTPPPAKPPTTSAPPSPPPPTTPSSSPAPAQPHSRSAPTPPPTTS